MRAVLLQAKFSGGAFRAPHETANAPPPRILRLRRKTAPKMKNRSRDPHHAPKGAADFAARRRQIILIVFGATCACQKTLLTERSVRACGACMQRSAISSKKEDGFRGVQLRKHSKAREKRYSFGYAVSFIFACYQILWTFPKSRYLCSRYLPLVCG